MKPYASYEMLKTKIELYCVCVLTLEFAVSISSARAIGDCSVADYERPIWISRSHANRVRLIL